MAALALTVALVAAAWMVYDRPFTGSPPQPSAADAFSTQQEGGSTAFGATHRVTALPQSEPVRIRIPSIRVDAPIARLGLGRGGRLGVPDESDRNLAGWYRGGTAPGATGNAIMDGHVDTRKGPAVFYLLGALRKGDIIEVDRRDGVAALFRVDAVELYPRTAFPSARVYGPTRDPELRVITCGGRYSGRTGYRGNVVVYAHLSGSRRA